MFDTCFDSRSNPFEERGDDVDQPKNTSKDPLHVPNGLMARSKRKAMNALVFKVLTKSNLKGPLEHQEEVLVHLIHVHEGPNMRRLQNKFYLQIRFPSLFETS